MKDLQAYWNTVQAAVCTRCIDSDGKGNCRLAEDEQCSLKTHFPSVVDTILSTQSDSLGPYMRMLREQVCKICDYQTNDGECAVRNEIACGLDRYFPLVVEAIENVTPLSPTMMNSGQANR